MAGITELAPLVGILTACAALGVPRASFYRRQRPVLGPKPRRSSPRALTPNERATVLSCLHEERFQDRAPAAVYATLLDEGRYHCSIRTMYRLLAQEGETRERRDQLTHPPYQKPELLATAPNRLGVGTSPSCWVRSSGPTSTSTSSWTSSAVTWWAGW
jgi:putative transposase